MEVKLHAEQEGFFPYQRDEKTLSRPWAVPGTPGLEHRIGGIEKANITGNVSCDPVQSREHGSSSVPRRSSACSRIFRPLKSTGAPEGKVLVLGWGGTYGAITTAVEKLQEQGASVSCRTSAISIPSRPILGRFWSASRG
jgi:2-oxoglutarate ferredoxin oxidoreductase subunit alpha